MEEYKLKLLESYQKEVNELFEEVAKINARLFILRNEMLKTIEDIKK